MNIVDAERNLSDLVDKVHREGISIDLERDNRVVARITPAKEKKPITLKELIAVIQTGPRLGDDADQFLQDLADIRNGFPPEEDP